MMRIVAAFTVLLLSGFLVPDISSSASSSDTFHANLAALQKTAPGSSHELKNMEPHKGMLRGAMKNLLEAHRYNFYKIIDGKRKVRGHVLLLEEMDSGFTFFEKDNLLLMGPPDTYDG